MRIGLLHVPIDAVTRNEAILRIARFFGEPRGHLVTTPNPEMLVMAHRDKKFGEVLSRADLAIPDGVGLVLMARLRGMRIPERITGVDFLTDIAELSSKSGKRVYFLGGGEGIAQAAAEALKRRFHGLIVAGAESGGIVRQIANGKWQIDEPEMESIRKAAPDVIFVAFGHGKQESWIADTLSELPTVRVAMGVGGSFDFIAGKAKRAPKAMRMLGLEWLWRLVREPWRIKRIWTAVVVFPWLVLSGKR